jgi:hypothetical protein
MRVNSAGCVEAILLPPGARAAPLVALPRGPAGGVLPLAGDGVAGAAGVTPPDRSELTDLHRRAVAALGRDPGDRDLTQDLEAAAGLLLHRPGTR